MRHTEFRNSFNKNFETSSPTRKFFYRQLWKFMSWGYGLLLFIATLTGYVPWLAYRLFIYKFLLRMKIGKRTVINNRTRFYHPFGIKVGSYTVINSNVFLDGREGLSIGDNVDIGSDVCIFTYEHDPQSPMFECKGGPVIVEDYVWISTRAMILPNVRVGKGSVVAAGAIVTKDVEPFTIVGGVPAKVIGQRNKDLRYQFDRYHISFQ